MFLPTVERLTPSGVVMPSHAIFERNQWTRMEFVDEEGLDAALARFDELT